MFEDRFTTTADGLRLNVRAYSGGDGTPVFCVPGLTRNAADFEALAPALAETARPVFAISLRGRARSDYAPDFRTYHPLVYRDDVLTALDQLGLDRAIFIGTSLGGMVSMLLHKAAPDRIAGVVINDIGPDLAPEGLARIAGYVGKTRSRVTSWEEAADQIRAINEVAFPGQDEAFWRTFAMRTFREEDGAYLLDYDAAIARAFAEGDPPPDLWGPFETLREKPTLLVRGEISDLLNAPIVDKMRVAHPNFNYCEVAGVGHAPTLTEPEALAAIKTFISDLD
ncbi:MAG: alpha/beta hydrolase [Pseudomonadota bacterium]